MSLSFTNIQLMTLWEQVAQQQPARRSLCLLAGLSHPSDSVGTLSVGERDRRLMLIRRKLFGDRIDGVTDCPQCGIRVELNFSISDVTSKFSNSSTNELSCDGYQVRWRLPTAQDLDDFADETVAARVREGLISRCLLEVRHHQEEIGALSCPEHVIEKVCEAMSQADPLGDTRLDLECPECGNSWKAAFDIGMYLWREIDVWAKRLVGEVHQIASVYGWSEQEILSMSATRRRLYLEMVGA